jgi:hypothetical protein
MNSFSHNISAAKAGYRPVSETAGAVPGPETGRAVAMAGLPDEQTGIPCGARLRQLAEAVAGSIPGCAGASSTVWHGGKLISAAATDPDFLLLCHLQAAHGSGPAIDAANGNGPGGCADTLTDHCWPAFSRAAAALGVRCAETVSYPPGSPVMLTVYHAAPRSLDAGLVRLAVQAASTETAAQDHQAAATPAASPAVP